MMASGVCHGLSNLNYRWHCASTHRVRALCVPPSQNLGDAALSGFRCPRTLAFLRGLKVILKDWIHLLDVNADSWAGNPSQIVPKQKTKGVPQPCSEAP